MIKRILIAALLLPLLAFGQSYPSPTFNNVTVNGTLTVSGGLPPSGLAPQAANTVLGNATGSSAVPTALAVPSCSTSTSALQWTSATGFSCYANSATTTGNLSQFASTTSAQLAGVLSDETGTGFAVFSASPALTGTPTAPTATAGTNTTQLATTAFVATSFAPLASPALTGTPTAPTAAPATNTTQLATTAFVLANSGGCTSCTITTPNIVGVSNGSNASAGSVGELITATGSAVSVTSGTPKDITSISLTAGDWEVTGEVYFAPAGSTVPSAYAGWVSSTSATIPPVPLYFSISGVTFAAGTPYCSPVPSQRFSLSSTTTVYLSSNQTFSTSTMTATGIIRARRVR